MYLLRRRRSVQRIQQKILPIVIGTLALGFLFVFILFTWFAKDLPAPGKLSQVTDNSTVFYDRNGKTLFELFKDKNRIPVPFNEISIYLKNATVAIEDKNFYKHSGISQTGILRSIFSILFRRKIQGGSTITQQLIKNVLLDSRQTIPRKIKEWIMAYSVEKKYSKDQILEMYLNEAPYGGTYCGVGSSSMAYFGKQPKDLNLLESAILAGIPQNPPYYSPFIGVKDSWKYRTKDVLRRMREDKYITKEQEKKTLSDLEKYKFSTARETINGPHFIFYVKDQIEKEFGSRIFDQGIKIKTTVSKEVQDTAEKIVKDEIAKLKGYNATNAAVVILDSKTGEILAMVGSYDYNDNKFGKFNAALGLRQPGSSIKPIAYALALEKGYTASTVIMDVKTSFPDQGDKEYIPVDYDGKYRGPMQIRFALANSINVSAVKIMAMIGIKDFLQKASDMGMTDFAPTENNLKRFGLSISLGGGETTLLDLTSAFSVFASGGIKRDVSSFLEINNFKGKKLYSKIKSKQQRILSPEVSFIISHILSDNNARMEIFGPNSYLNVPGRTVAVKTGTTDDKRDNWAVGYTNSITVGVWVGNNDNSPMNPKIASGATGASPIWYDLMRQLLNPTFSKKEKYIDGIMDKPDKVKALTIDAYLGGLPKDGYPTRSEYYIEGSEPKDVSSFYKTLKISKANGKLANEVEIKNGNYEEKDYIVITESDPVSADGKNRWQEGIDAWAREQGDGKFHPPTEISDASADSVIVSIKSPNDKSSNLSLGNIDIKAKITSMNSIKNIKIYLNNTEVRSIDGNNSEINETMDFSEGVYELKIKAVNEKDKSGESTIKFGVNKPWDDVTPAPTASSTPATPTVSP